MRWACSGGGVSWVLLLGEGDMEGGKKGGKGVKMRSGRRREGRTFFI